MSEGKYDDAAGMDWDDVTCSICAQVFVSPRVFPGCGHSICQSCAMNCDEEATDAPNAHTAKTFSCPFCRATTIVPWYARAINRDLEKLASKHPSYDKRKREMPDPEMNVEDISTTGNLAEECREARVRIAAMAYGQILPQVVAAARNGQSYLIIKEPNLIRDAELVLDLLSLLLFKKGCFKITVNPGYKELTITILRTAFSVRKSYVNSAYEDGGASTDGEGARRRPGSSLSARIPSTSAAVSSVMSSVMSSVVSSAEASSSVSDAILNDSLDRLDRLDDMEFRAGLSIDALRRPSPTDSESFSNVLNRIRARDSLPPLRLPELGGRM